MDCPSVSVSFFKVLSPTSWSGHGVTDYVQLFKNHVCLLPVRYPVPAVCQRSSWTFRALIYGPEPCCGLFPTRSLVCPFSPPITVPSAPSIPDTAGRTRLFLNSPITSFTGRWYWRPCWFLLSPEHAGGLLCLLDDSSGCRLRHLGTEVEHQSADLQGGHSCTVGSGPSTYGM